MLAGPGVLRRLDDLPHVRVERLNISVANTWGAKGTYPWDDPHHMGTCGLQARDFELLGFRDFDVVLAIGLDEAESPGAVRAPPDDEVAAVHLGELADGIPRRSHELEPNELFDRLARRTTRVRRRLGPPSPRRGR